MASNRRALLAVGLTVLAVVAAGTVAGLGTAGADEPTAQPSQRTVAVDAIGEAEASPDKAIVELAVTASGDDPSAIRDELATGASNLREELDSIGVDYETRYYSIDENHRRGPREGSGPDAAYRGAHVFVVTLDNTDNVGTVVDSAAGVGAEVHNVRLTLSDEKREQLREQAIDDAMDDARQQANSVAQAGNLEVTGVVTVDATERRYRPVEFSDSAAGAGAAEPPTQIATGDVSVTYSVDVTFEATA